MALDVASERRLDKILSALCGLAGGATIGSIAAANNTDFGSSVQFTMIFTAIFAGPEELNYKPKFMDHLSNMAYTAICYRIAYCGSRFIYDLVKYNS